MTRAIFAALLLFPQGTLAVQSDSLGVYPKGLLESQQPWFRWTLHRNSATSAKLMIDNRSDQPQTMEIYPVDAWPTGEGGFGMAPQSASRNDAGSWIKLQRQRLTIAPHSIHETELSVFVPPTAAVGNHFAGIVVQPVGATTKTDGQVGLRVIKRLGVRVYITVPGTARPGLEIKTLELLRGQRIALKTRLKNTGNTIVAPKGELVVRPLLGKSVHTKVNIGSSLRPGETLEAKLPTKLKPSFPMIYSAALTIKDQSGKELGKRSINFWSGSILWLLVPVLVAVAVGLGLKYGAYSNRHRHQRQP